MKSATGRNAFLTLLLFTVPVPAAKFCETKEFTAWSEKKCMEMLRKSPWAFTNTFVNQPAIILDPGARSVIGESDFFEFRILSAKPIRMAFARLELLKRPNDPELPGRTLNMVNQDPGKEIAIHVSYRVVPTGSSAPHEIDSYFLHASLAEFRHNTYLEGDQAGNIQVAGYLAPNPQRPNAMFPFPRFNDAGHPISQGQETSITFRLEFNPEIHDSKRIQCVRQNETKG
jgi:hypothetical protein